jgi:hypothetical protein
MQGFYSVNIDVSRAGLTLTKFVSQGNKARIGKRFFVRLNGTSNYLVRLMREFSTYGFAGQFKFGLA